jgi:hypothetical protein
MFLLGLVKQLELVEQLKGLEHFMAGDEVAQ